MADPQQTLAQKVRAKYPGVYDDMDDATLDAKVRAKFPGVYDDLPPSAPAATTSRSSEDWLLERGAIPGADTGRLGMIADAARGAGSGALSTVYHAGDLIRRGLGMDRIIEKPEVQAEMTPPPTTAGKVGFWGEQGAEYLVPATKIAKAVKGAPILARMGAEALGSAGVAGAQTGGDPMAMALASALTALIPPAFVPAKAAGKAIQRGAAGAGEGGFGGAVAAGLRAVAPSDTKTLLTQGLKPRSTKVFFDNSLDLAVPEIKAAEQVAGKPITDLGTMMDAVRVAKKRIQSQLNGMRAGTGTIQIDLSPVADAMVSSIPKKVALETPDAAAKLVASADVYRKTFTLDAAETLLRETNAELEGLYAMYPGAQRHALISNPAVASLDAQAKALRTVIYRELDAPGQGAAARELNRKYGALLDVESEAYRRLNVARRQQPESLSEQIGTVRAVADMARGTWKIAHGNLSGAADIAAAHAGRSAAKFLKEQQTTDALIRRAFQAYRGPARTPEAAVRGLLEQGAIRPAPSHVADTSFVRGVPAEYAQRDVAGLLPAHRPAIITPVTDTSSVAAKSARKSVQRDPRTGKMRRIYSSGGE